MIFFCEGTSLGEGYYSGEGTTAGSEANDECGELIRRKTLARLKDRDDSSDDANEELEAQHTGKATAAEKGKGKTANATPSDPTLVTRLPSTGVVTGTSPTAVALAAAHQPRLQTSGSKRNSDSSAATTTKRLRRPSDVIPEDVVATTMAFIFHRLEQTITASDLQATDGASPSYLLQSTAYHSFQLFQVGFNNAIMGLAKDSELLKSAKLAHSKEVKTLKADMANAIGGEILMDNAYLNSPANLNSIAGMDRASVLTSVKDDEGDATTTEEEDPSAALQLNRQRSRSFERNLPTRPSEVDADGVSLSEA
nr:hypothetical protein Iba_chr12cCG11190 [Ipomoea batatas]